MQKHIDKVHEIIQGSAGTYRKFQEGVRSEIRKIELDSKYSADGKAILTNSIKKEKTEDLMLLSRDMRKAIREELDAAKKAAERILNAPIKKADAASIERFQKQLNELKTLVALNPNPQRAKQQISEFAAAITDPYLADIMRDDFGTLIIPVVAKSNGTEGGRTQLELSDLYSSLKERFVTPEQQEARDVLNTVEMMSERNVFSPVVIDAVRADLGVEAAAFVNKPDEYIEKLKAVTTEAGA